MTVFLIRHGSAGLRNDGDPSDVERHLDDIGTTQAAKVAALLAHGAPEASWSDSNVVRVLSSPAARCVETVEPLAQTLSLPVTTTDVLLEGADLERAWDLVESVALADGDSVLCSHGDLIPELIRRARLRGMAVPTKSGCSKGSIWALSWDGERFDTGSYVTTR